MLLTPEEPLDASAEYQLASANRQALAEAPCDAAALYALAASRARSKEWEAALRCLERATMVAPDPPNFDVFQSIILAAFSAATQHYQAGQFEVARALYRRIHRLRPEIWQARRNIDLIAQQERTAAATAFRHSRDDEAVALCRRVLADTPDDAAAQYILNLVDLWRAPPEQQPWQCYEGRGEGKKPLLTIAIPTWNRAAKLARCLDAFVEQILADGEGTVEICLSDNASDDGTPAIIEDYRARHDFIRSRRNPINVGAFQNLYDVIGLIDSEYVWYFGDDDLPAAGAIKEVLRILRATNPDVCLLQEEYATECEGDWNAGRLIDLCNKHGWLSLTGSLCRQIIRRPDFRQQNNALYRHNSFPMSCFILEAYADRPTVIPKRKIIADLPRTAEETAEFEKRWTEDDVFHRYIYVLDAIEYMVSNNIIKKVKPEFFMIGQNSLTSRLFNWCILPVVRNQPGPKKEYMDYILKIERLVDSTEFRRMLLVAYEFMIHCINQRNQAANQLWNMNTRLFIDLL